MCVLSSSIIFVWNISRSKKNWARCDRKCIFWSSCKVLVIRVWFWLKLGFSRWFFEKCSSTLWKTSSPTRTDGKTDGHDEVNSGFSKNLANSPKHFTWRSVRAGNWCSRETFWLNWFDTRFTGSSALRHCISRGSIDHYNVSNINRIS